MSDFSENKYDDIRLPSYEESSIIDKITEDRNRLIKATSELDRIKIEMELRIRAEMEERIRQEEIEKKKKEESDKQRLYKELSMEIEKTVEDDFKLKLSFIIPLFPKDKDEIILFVGCSAEPVDSYEHNHCSLQKCKSEPHAHRTDIKIIITNKNFYGLRRKVIDQTDTGKYCLDLLYTFDNELSSKDIAIISQLFVRKGKYNVSFMEEQFTFNSFNHLYKIYINYKKIESVIRLVLGSYKNGDWEQLDGFYGMYFNRKTLELSEFPPPLTPLI